MASDVDDLSTFYASLPSIFANDPLTTSEPIFAIPALAVDSEKPYQSMFGSFLFADSEPLTRAAFVASASSSSEMKPKEEQLIEDDSPSPTTTKTTLTSSSDNPGSPPPPLAPTEDISDMEDNDDIEDEEDDFDGIPIRHATNLIKTKLNGGTDLILPPTDHDRFLDRLARHIDLDGNQLNNGDDDDDEDAFLNGFTDDQQHESIAGPSLFKDIPDIDDPNGHEDDEDERISLDRMDMLDQSDSIRSSSPDSLLSSSHLRDEHDDLDDDDDDDHVLEMNRIDDDDDNGAGDDDDVTQWNDDFLLAKPNAQHDRPHAPSPPLLPLNSHPHDQVDFIDSSRSASRCSNASSHLSNGYNDQGRIFLNDDELVTSSDSDDESNHEIHDEKVNIDDAIFDRDHDEELSLQINLDQPRSRSLSRSSSSTRSSSPLPDQSPIVAIDDEVYETKPLPVAPIAQVDDDDDEEQDDEEQEENADLPLNQPVLAKLPWKDLLESHYERRRRDELVHDIIDCRHIYEEHENDDEFIAVMHNPLVFEEVLHDIDDRQVKDNLLTDQLEYRRKSSLHFRRLSPSQKVKAIRRIDSLSFYSGFCFLSSSECS